MFALVVAALLFLSLPQSALSCYVSADTCDECRCSIYVGPFPKLEYYERPPEELKVIEYGEVTPRRCRDNYVADIESDCKRACTSRCSGDMQNAALLCNKDGGTFDSKARTFRCFSDVQYCSGKEPGPGTVLSVTTVNGCKKTCTCPVPGLYDVMRGSCVKAAGCATVPGMPNGDKGGGYFATAGKLYRNVPGAVCRASLI